jgi:hypothetical protein
VEFYIILCGWGGGVALLRGGGVCGFEGGGVVEEFCAGGGGEGGGVFEEFAKCGIGVYASLMLALTTS